MVVFKCKMCGGDLQVEQGKTVGICDSCGTQQTLPKLDNDRRTQMYDRANHFRRNNDYDKAAGIYETILNEDGTDSEAYWSLVLCKYGVEYVEDPMTKKRTLTCNRTQLTSVLADEDYKQALANADGNQRTIYEEEARAIDKIQKGILEISNREEPFDVFICYKETDEQGNRTRESVTAQELYHELTREGFKVFFARITLENVLGTAYEPYIFAALNSSKVMVVVGTKLENFNAVWVKNEWSRYLALIKGGAKKVLIPAYRDMDAYDLPDEFSHLQAQDMNKLGFMQDLIRGIKKITGADAPKPVAGKTVHTASNAGVGGNAEALLKRAYIFLEDGDFTQAREYFNRILDADPENATAYVGLLCAEMNVRREEDLANANSLLSRSVNYKNALRFADDRLRAALQGYERAITDRLEKAQQEAEECRRREEELQRQEEERQRQEEKERREEERRELERGQSTAEKKIKKWEIIRIIGIAAIIIFLLGVLLYSANNYRYSEEASVIMALIGILSPVILPLFTVSLIKIWKFNKNYGMKSGFYGTHNLEEMRKTKKARLIFSLVNAVLLFIVPWATYNKAMTVNYGGFFSGSWKENHKLELTVLGIAVILIFFIGLLSKKPIKKKGAVIILGLDFAWVIVMLVFRVAFTTAYIDGGADIVNGLFIRDYFIAALYLANFILTLTVLPQCRQSQFPEQYGDRHQAVAVVASNAEPSVTVTTSANNSQTTRTCASCGAELSSAARFCGKCGATAVG